MKILFTLTFIIATIFSLTAKDKISWFDGKIILMDDQEITGEVSYNYKHGVIMHKNESGITKAFSAAQVQYFEYFDGLMQVPRRYIALPFHTDKNYRNDLFFELIMEGDVAVFRKEKKNINLEFIRQHDNANFTRYHSSFDYYFFKDGAFTPLNKFSDKLLPVVKANFPTQMDVFIKDNDLNVENGIHAILVIDFYNSLVDATIQNTQVAQTVKAE